VRKTAGSEARAAGSNTIRRLLSAWNRRLLIAASVFVLWACSVLTLQAAGPHAQNMIAGEGMLITMPE
jgi:hypothetical protein